MKIVLAIVPPSRMEAVRQALAEVHVTRLSIVDGHGYRAASKSGGGLDVSRPSSRIVRHAVLEIAVNDDFLERTVEVIERALQLAADSEAAASEEEAATDPGGIYVLPMAEAVQIYRDVRGPEAL
jgi:nitrogen regulatory protein P-II 1